MATTCIGRIPVVISERINKIRTLYRLYRVCFKNNKLYADIDPVFSLFPTSAIPQNDETFYHNFIGGKVRKEYFKLGLKLEDDGRIEQPYWSACVRTNKDPRYACSEDYYEWLDLLTAIANARDSFTLLKLGAFAGRWEAFGAIANHSYKKLKCRLISVEYIQKYIAYIAQTFRDNDIMGFPEVEHEIVPLRVSRETGDDTISLKKLINKCEVVDLIDSDIQGAEGEVFDYAAVAALNNKVKRVHIGTHSKKIDIYMKEFFTDIGWQNIHLFGCNEKVILPQGKITFQDGIQTWVNPRFCGRKQV